MSSGFFSFALKKIVSCLISLWVIITLTFFLMKAVPGDPLTQEQSLPKEVYDNLISYYGFDEPLDKQYLSYLNNILRLDLGPSLVHSTLTTSGIIADSFPVSGLLGVEALILALTAGIGGGILTALAKGRWAGMLNTLLTATFLSIPSFILGAALQYFFAIHYDILPVARWESFSHTILPVVALAAMPAAFLAKVVRANLLHVLGQDYIFFAKAKGLTMRTILFRHALRNAMLPLLGYLGKTCANILVGSFIIEKIFTIPGLGYWFVSSISNRDYPMIMGLTIFYSVVLLTSLLIADLLHAWMDSRLYRRNEVFA